MSSSLSPPLLLSATSRLQAKLQYPACFAPAALQRHPGITFLVKTTAHFSEKKWHPPWTPFNHPTTHLPVPAVPGSGHLGGKRKMAREEKDHRCLGQYGAHSELKCPGLEAGESGAGKWVSHPRSLCSASRVEADIQFLLPWGNSSKYCQRAYYQT